MADRRLTIGFARAVKGRGLHVVLDGADPPMAGEIFSDGKNRWRVLTMTRPFGATRENVWVVTVAAMDSQTLPTEGSAIVVEAKERDPAGT